MSEKELDLDKRFQKLRTDIFLMRTELLAEVRKSCPGIHRGVQHRDARPPWCKSCGRTDEGLRIK